MKPGSDPHHPPCADHAGRVYRSQASALLELDIQAHREQVNGQRPRPGRPDTPLSG